MTPAEYRAITERVLRFCEALPQDRQPPEITPEPEGEAIMVGWFVSRDRGLHLEIQASDRVPYAWLDGDTSGSGVATFDGTTIPPEIAERVAALVPLREEVAA